jgi:hypothetical protein
MGIIATGTLPSGVQVTRVYMSFNGESVYVKPVMGGRFFECTVCYKVFSDATKAGGAAARIPMQIVVPETDFDQSVFRLLYAHLKSLYPQSVDYLPNETAGP